MPEHIVVPSLSAKGWVRALPEKCDTLLAHFYASDINQSLLYANNVTNVQGILQRNMHDIDGLCQDMRTMLEGYMSRYFDQATVTVTDDRATNPSNKITLNIRIEITDDGRYYDAGYQAAFIDSKFEKIVNLNNTGSITR